MIRQGLHYDRYFLTVVSASLCGCAAMREPPSPPNVHAAWGQERTKRVGHVSASLPDPSQTAARSQTDTGRQVLAVVNGRPIQRERFLADIMASYGAAVLEVSIDLELACGEAADRGLAVTQADLRRERELTLRKLADPMFSGFEQAVPTAQEDAANLLDRVLITRNLSERGFDRLVQRNACLRKIVESKQSFTESQLHEEFEQIYGKRAQVRHIQLATLAEAERIKQQLENAADFAELSRRYSANAVSAADGGRLQPFSANDRRIPDLFRRVAFSLRPGEVSDPVRIGQWYHLIKLESILPQRQAEFSAVRKEVEASLRRRQAEPAMYELLDSLRRGANVTIYDPVLAKAYETDRSRREGK